MTHDPLCSVQDDDPLPLQLLCICGELSAARRDMLAKCIAAVEAYADERLAVTKNPNMSEDITSALRVAANRLRALQEVDTPQP